MTTHTILVSTEPSLQRKGGRYGRAKHFALGYKANLRRRGKIEIKANYTDHDGAPVLECVQLNATGISLSLHALDSSTPNVAISDESGAEYKIAGGSGLQLHRRANVGGLRFLLRELHYYLESSNDSSKKLPRELMARIRELQMTIGRSLPYTASIAPMRTKPQRTYDQFETSYSPEGEHVPYLLENIMSNPDLAKTVRAFGQSSGLFSNLRVKRWGRGKGEPMQIEINHSVSRKANLVDVGYGVSQALPVIVESILDKTASTLLLQQPEVHLHPKAQAALGSFFVQMIADHKKSYIVETHSDYIIDRVRLEIAKKNISHNDVALVFVKKSGHTSTINHIQLDKLGNIINPPAGYRDFFLREQMDMLER